MDFIYWWFDEHYVWSTLLSPFVTFLWCCFKGLGWRGFSALMIWFFWLILGKSLEKRLG